MVKINGQAVDAKGKTISQILAENNYSERLVAVEINEDIIPKEQYASATLSDGDVMEIVSFMGGG